MISVMIVEDEPPLARALEKLISRVNPEFEVKGIAENGKDAIEKYIQLKPDVVFTDIKMPIMDGFQFLEYLKQNKEQPVTMILSGYEDFNYARQAILYQVKGYLLKPVSKAELEKSLGEIQDEIYANKKAEKENYVRTKLLESRQEIESGNCTVGLFCFGAYPMIPDDGMLPGLQDLINLDFEKITEKVCPECSSWVINGSSSVEKIVIMEHNKELSGHDFIRKVFEEVIQQCKYPVTCVTHGTDVSISSIGSIYKKLKLSLYKNLVFGTSCIYCYDHMESANESEEIEKALQTLNKEIIFSDVNVADEQLKRFLDVCEKRNVSQRKLVKYLNVIMRYYYERYPMMETRELEVEMILANAKGYTELYGEIVDFLNMLCCVQKSMQEVNPLARKVKHYMDQNYHMPITSESLASEFGFVATYLSRVFKNQYGMTPSAYLVKIRIDHAKELLKKQGDCLVKEVAEAVGYNDPYYFSKVFHKETSMWPTDFKA